jgi:predicted NUDIX family NTP pyrophosphohydrolase
MTRIGAEPPRRAAMVTRSRKESAGILAFRGELPELQVFLAHPGGPVFRRKDAGVWTIPKGEINEGEEPLAAARREFEEETSFRLEGPFLPLGSVKLKSGKIVHAWACRAELDPLRVKSITFRMEWPPRSGKLGEYPEVDRGDYFSLELAKEKLNEAQGLLLPRLVQVLAEQG